MHCAGDGWTDVGEDHSPQCRVGKKLEVFSLFFFHFRVVSWLTLAFFSIHEAGAATCSNNVKRLSSLARELSLVGVCVPKACRFVAVMAVLPYFTP